MIDSTYTELRRSKVVYLGKQFSCVGYWCKKRVKNLPTCTSLPANIITTFARILLLEVFDPCLWTDWGARPREICIWVPPPDRSDGKLVQVIYFFYLLPLIGRSCSPDPQTNKLLFHWKPLWLCSQRVFRLCDIQPVRCCINDPLLLGVSDPNLYFLQLDLTTN